MVPDYFIVKTSGGIASQLLGLMSAIEISASIKRPFKIKHYPYSTGGYYPFAIRSLLKDSEVLDLAANIRGMEGSENHTVGSIVESHPQFTHKFSFYAFLRYLSKMRLDKVLNLLRFEWQLNTETERLVKTPRKIRSVSGGYPPFYSHSMEYALRSRFKAGGLPWPFEGTSSKKINPDVVIHYRLGDKRAAFSRSGMGGAVHSIIDPQSFKEILSSLELDAVRGVFVISDEPKTAVKLLGEVGIVAQPNPVQGDIWEDMALMSRGKVILCPWSSVSQIVAVFASNDLSKKIFYPKFPGIETEVGWKIVNVNFFNPKYLTESHWVYTDGFSSDDSAHNAYH